MRAIVAIAVLLVGVASRPAMAQGPVDAGTRAELERARDVVWRAWFAGDTQTLDRVLAGALAAGDDTDGWSDRKQAISDSHGFAKTGGKLVDLKFDSTSIQLHGSVAVMAARYSYTTADSDGKKRTTSGYAVEIFIREKGAWTHPFWHLARQGT